MELLDIVDENNNLTGRKEERKIIHQKGLWHRHVGAWIMNEKGELLFQKRAPSKPINPNKWSRTGGHVDAGENPIDAIQRETKEEIGVSIPKEKWELLSIDKYVKENDLNHHFTYNYFTYVNYKIEEYTIQKQELSAVKYLSIEEMEEINAKKDMNYTFTNKKGFEKTIEILKQKRKDLKIKK